MTAPTYTYEGAGTRWAEDDAMHEDFANVSRINNDHNNEQLDRLMADSDALEGPYTQTYFEGDVGDAYKLVIVDLDDPDTVWDLSRFMAQARNTSWWAELGPPPVHGGMWVNNTKKALRWFDRETGEVYMYFAGANGNNILRNGPHTLRFLDGKIYVGHDTSTGLCVVDLLRDRCDRYDASYHRRYKGNVSERNDTNGWQNLEATLVLGNDDVYCVDAIRDRFGRVDEFGRPLQWWAVACDDGANGVVSAYNARDNAIYSSGNVERWRSVALSPTTGNLYAGEISSTESVVDFGPTWSIDADSFAFSRLFAHTISAPEILDGDPKHIAILPGRSAAVEGGDVLVVATTNIEPGLSLLHTDPLTPTIGGAVHITADYNSPYMKGNAALSLPFEGDGVDVSHQANTLTATGAGVTYAAAVIGLGATFDGVDYIGASGLSGLDVATDGDFTVALWVKSTSSSNPASFEQILDAEDSTATGAVAVYFNSTGYMTFAVTDDGSVVDTVTPSVDLYDGLWHHIVGVRRSGTMYLYVDGVEVGSSAATTVAVSMDEAYIGADSAGNWQLNGSVDDVSFSVDAAWTIEEVRWNYQRGLRAQSSSAGNADQALTTSDMDDVTVDQRSGLIIATNGTEFSIWDEFGGMVAEQAPLTGTGKGGAIRLMPGAAIHYLRGDSADIGPVQPASRLADRRHKPRKLWRIPDRPGFTVSVELDGSGDFYRIQDAVDYCSEGDTIYVGPGQHDNPFDVNKDNMTVRGSGRGTVITNYLSSLADHAVNPLVGWSGITIRDMAAETEFGEGTNYAPFIFHASNCMGVNLWVLQSDQDGIQINAPICILMGCYVEDADDNCVEVPSLGDNSIIACLTLKISL